MGITSMAPHKSLLEAGIRQWERCGIRLIMTLAMQLGSRGVIGAVDLGMTVQAGAAKQESVFEAIVCVLAGISPAGVARRRVALLAKQRRTPDQQGRVVTTMWPVAQSTVFGNRRMFPQERPALFRMTAITGQIDGGAL